MFEKRRNYLYTISHMATWNWDFTRPSLLGLWIGAVTKLRQVRHGKETCHAGLGSGTAGSGEYGGDTPHLFIFIFFHQP